MSAAYEYLRNQPAARALQRYAKRALGIFRWIVEPETKEMLVTEFERMRARAACVS